VAPIVYFTHCINLGKQTQINSFAFVDPLTQEVRSTIFNEEWSPVLSLSIIVLALELLVFDPKSTSPLKEKPANSMELELALNTSKKRFSGVNSDMENMSLNCNKKRKLRDISGFDELSLLDGSVN
jgi:hypothetical protein